MDNVVFSVDSLFDGNQLLGRQTVTLENGRIKSIADFDPKAPDSVSGEQLCGVLVPGFIDIQVNGGGGVLFNHSPDVQAISAIGRAHRKYGTTGWFPTLISDSFEQMHQAADAVAKAREHGEAGVLGIHFEGPHLSPSKKGVHPAQHLRELTQAELDIYLRQDIGQVIVTLAPEMVAPELIAALKLAGVIICLGHSNADFQQTLSALEVGASGFTHLFNAMSGITSREPGMVGAALYDQSSYYGLIADGVHVHPASAKLALRANSRMMLVTDAMSPAASDQSEFEFFGETVKRHNDRLLDHQGRLAGSSLTMIDAVNNSQSMIGVSFSQAINMASFNPAKFLGVEQDYGSLTVAKKANMLLLDSATRSRVLASWIDGDLLE